MSKSMIKWTLGLLAVGCMLAMAGPAAAEWIPPMKDSSTFTRQYEMTTYMPSELDLDGNGTMDFRYKTYGGSSASIIEGGLLHMLSPGSSAYVYIGANDIDGRIWKADGDNYTFAEGYTIEASIRVNSSTGDLGAWCIAAAPLGAPDTTRPNWRLNISDTGQLWGDTAIGGTVNNTDGFHVFRVTQKENTDLFRVWRDSDLLGEFAAPGTTTGAGSMYFGDPGSKSNWKGEVDVDYFRMTKGAYAPIPEPSTLILLVGGLLSLLVWRRR